MNNTRTAERDVIFFNQVPRTGSMTMKNLLSDLANINDFTAYSNDDAPDTTFDFDPEEEEEFLEEFFDLEGYFSYSEHRSWINFNDYDLPRPIYMSLVRHPIEKVMSAYYLARHPYVFNRQLLESPDNNIPGKQYFDTSFNDCVAKDKQPFCRFYSKMLYNEDWRRMAVHFCGKKELCK